MEVTANNNQYLNEEGNVEVEQGLQRKRVIKRTSSSSSSTSSDSDKHIQTKGLEGEELEEKTEVNAETILQNGEETESNAILPASDAPIPVPEDSTISLNNNNVTTTITEIGTAIGIVNVNGQERQELYLERVYPEKPPTHGFYCPNCNACIQKVYIIQTVTVQQNDRFRCSSCFSFLIPIGNWLFPCFMPAADEPNVQGLSNNNRLLEGSIQSEKVIIQSVTNVTSNLNLGSTAESVKQTLQIIEETGQEVAVGAQGEVGSIARDISGIKELQDSTNPLSATSREEGKDQVAKTKKYFWSDWKVIRSSTEAPPPKQPEIPSSKDSDWKVIASSSSHATTSEQLEKQPEHVEVRVDDREIGAGEEVVPAITTPLLTPTEPPVPTTSGKKLEILKSIVYGGLAESLASLSVVTSAASADAKTLNIVALAIANLIGGLIALVHNLRELKAEKPKREENNTEEQVDRYNELLGLRENFILHSFIAILSFIVFGLVPPLVYGFSFRDTDDKDFKLAAVAVASIICITFLSIAKAHIKRPNSFSTYFQTVVYYVSTGAVASVLSYLAGNFVKKLVEQIGWFDPPASNNSGLQIGGISVQRNGFGSY